MEFDPNQIIFEAATEALQNYNLPRRRIVLTALKVKLPAAHPSRQLVDAQLAMLDGLDALQTELHLSFKGGAK